jgi:hypothetical protein
MRRGLFFLMFGFLTLAISAQNFKDHVKSPPMGSNTFAKKRSKAKFQVHKIIDTEDQLSSDEIVEFRNDDGISVWFSREIQKSVCLDQKCKLIHLKIYWDGVGNYKKLEILENKPLTKTDHSIFNQEDYKKLHRILSDSLSVLKELKMDELIVKDKSTGIKQIDANSGATRLSLKEYLVKNAAYTCYTLWHTVYGPTRNEIQSIIDQCINVEYLGHIFRYCDPAYHLWAIEYIEKHPEYQQMFSGSIAELIKSENQNVSKRAFAYFIPSRLTNVQIQKKVAGMLGMLQMNMKNELIARLCQLQFVQNETFLILLGQFDKKLIDAGLLRKIFDGIHPRMINDPQIIRKLEALNEHENPFVREMAKNLRKKSI